ncbi:MAG: glycosyltransferase [Marinilabiliaceae bacterium]|nr:glycosyltransferase [Marinilabiliaceae bacterium]
MDNLVSVVVVTYQSSSFIIETLNSIYNQTWGNIELIVTDDASKDNTVALCKDWIEKNGDRFVRTVVVETETNSGVPANLNRGIKEVTGEWISFPAGDDTLKTGCINDNMEYVEEHPDICVLFSAVDVYKDTFTDNNYHRTIKADPDSLYSIMSLNRTAESQYKMLLLSDRINITPSLFLKKDALISVGGFDERFKLIEDHPLWLNLTKNGYKLYYMDKATVNYRMHSSAINNTGNNHLVNPNYFRLESFRRIYTYPNLPLDIRLNQRFTWYILQLFKNEILNRKTKLNSFLLRLFTYYLNPFWYYVRAKKQIIKGLKSDEFYM